MDVIILSMELKLTMLAKGAHGIHLISSQNFNPQYQRVEFIYVFSVTV